MTPAAHLPRIVKRLALLLASFVLVLVAGCGGSDKGSSADPPADFRVQAGDGSVIITWTAEPETEYWIFFGVGPDINTTNWATRGGVAITNAISPRIITGLTNGTTYSFTINARKNKGPGGSGAPTQVAVPLLAGENWAPGALLGTQKLNAIAAGPFVSGFNIATVGDAGTIFSSVNNGPMTARTNPLPTTNLYGVAYGLAGFMAVGDGGVILRSQDAITWTQQTSGTLARLNAGVSSATAVYVVVGAGGTIVTSSDGGVAWSTPGSGTTNDLFGVTWGANRFVTVGADGTILYGTTGSDWQPAVQLTQRTLRAATFGAFLIAGQTAATNLYVVVGDGGAVLTSPDTVSWTLLPPFTTKNLLGVTFGGRFVAVGEDGSIFTSPDGVTWSAQNSGTTADLTSVTRQISGYTAVGEAGTNVSTF